MIKNYSLLIDLICKMDEVLSVGKCGGEKLPEKNESDIDVFVFCSKVPDANTRHAIIGKLGSGISCLQISETKDKFWGFCNFITIEDVEICLMYFTISDMDDEIESVLNGSRLDREDEYFYPTGRCATLLSMQVYCDKKGYISAMKEKLSLYPEILAQKLFNHHISKINDIEDFSRAVSRKDVLFYHTTLESAIDHFLQALFALNRCFFPSRKRTLEFIKGFKHKPKNCAERLLKVIELGSKPETLSKSYDIWSALCIELSKKFY